MPNKKIPPVNNQDDDQPVSNIYTRNFATTQQQGNEVEPQQSEEVTQQNSNKVIPQEGKTIKASIYLTSELTNKLKDLEFQYWNKHHKEIDRNKIIRHLLEKSTIDDLDDLQVK